MDQSQAFENHVQDLLQQTLESSADPMLSHLLIQLTAMLRGLPLAGLVGHIQAGQPFYLSTVLEAGDGH